MFLCHCEEYSDEAIPKKNTMFILTTYDISDDKRRNKICKTLKDFGERVQYSVFECNLTEQHLTKMLNKLLKIINEKEDSVRVYKICESCKKNVKIFGSGKISEDEEIYIV